MSTVVRQLSTRDPDEARARLSDVYCPHRLTLVGGSEKFNARQSATGFPGLRLFDLVYGGDEVRVDPVPFDEFVLITRPLRGRFAVRSAAEGLVTTNRDALVMDAYGSYQLRWYDSCEVLNMVLDRRTVERVAAELRGFDEPRPIRFEVGPPVSAVAAGTWERVTRFLVDAVEAAGPLVQAEMLRLAVGALLEAYPSSFTTAADPDTAGSGSAAAVRRAKAYIEMRADEDVTLTDIAAAARLSVRGLQAAFRRHEGSTPMAHLRRERLHRAHAELRDRSAHDTTVAAVATRWGFLNLGRFAGEHRAAFGSSPSDVLRA